ncbi:MAG: class I SAM-dependent methyltransferase [Oligoflexia bacterium]|nr:class I SAM-dependent methyltransferase [Oligoflexia bacterium]
MKLTNNVANRKKLDGIARRHSTLQGFDYWVTYFSALKLVNFCKGPSILELGCADGLMTDMLSSKFTIVDCVDGSPVMVKRAKKNIKNDEDNVRFYTSLFEDFTSDRKYKTIVISHVLEHVERPLALLRKFKNFLEPDGRIIICVPNANSFHRKMGVELGILKKITDLSKKDYEVGHRRVYSFHSLRGIINRADLKIINEGGFFLKILSGPQMKIFNRNQLQALFNISNKFPEYCSEIFCICKVN